MPVVTSSACLYDLSPLCSSADCIDDLHVAMKGGASSDGQVCVAELVIAVAHNAHNVQMGVLLSQGVCDSPLKNTHTRKSATKTWPFIRLQRSAIVVPTS